MIDLKTALEVFDYESKLQNKTLKYTSIDIQTFIGYMDCKTIDLIKDKNYSIVRGEVMLNKNSLNN